MYLRTDLIKGSLVDLSYIGTTSDVKDWDEVYPTMKKTTNNECIITKTMKSDFDLNACAEVMGARITNIIIPDEGTINCNFTALDLLLTSTVTIYYCDEVLTGTITKIYKNACKEVIVLFCKNQGTETITDKSHLTSEIGLLLKNVKQIQIHKDTIEITEDSL
jgi:hypothetical protein